jgi:hypothetical protein
LKFGIFRKSYKRVIIVIKLLNINIGKICFVIVGDGLKKSLKKFLVLITSGSISKSSPIEGKKRVSHDWICIFRLS